MVARTSCAATNVRTQLIWIIRRASPEPWPRRFHNLRANRQTELFLSNVVCKRLGTTVAVAGEHYLPMHDDHFTRAISQTSGCEATHNPTQRALARRRTTQKEHTPFCRKSLRNKDLRANAIRCKSLK